MKKAAIFILFCAAAVPAALVAQSNEQGASEQRVIRTKWTLKQPKQKQQPKQLVVGPAVPRPPSVRVPKPAQRAARPAPKQRPNNTALVNAIASGKRKQRN